MTGDVVALPDETVDGIPLLRQVMANGRRTGPMTTLEDARTHHRDEMARLPQEYKLLEALAEYPVQVSEGIRALAREADRLIAAAQ